MQIYKHTQIGCLIIAVAFLTALFFVWIYLTVPEDVDSVLVGVIMISIVLLLLSFSILQTIVDGKYIRIQFSFGVFKKKFQLEDVLSVKVVRNKWYFGWGVRVWFWPYMWIYNVSGLDAVELVMKNGNIYRIGTDHPEQLEEAIMSQLNI